MIGLTVHALPAEPMAAAVAHGLDGNTQARTFLVFDLGGGTFDVTILQRHDDGQLEAISHHGDRRLGGADFDRLIVARMTDLAMRTHRIVLDADPVDLAEAYAKAEQVKKDLSSRDRAQAALIVGGKRMTFELTRDGVHRHDVRASGERRTGRGDMPGQRGAPRRPTWTRC